MTYLRGISEKMLLYEKKPQKIFIGSLNQNDPWTWDEKKDDYPNRGKEFQNITPSHGNEKPWNCDGKWEDDPNQPFRQKGKGTAYIEKIKPAFPLAVSGKVSISRPGGKAYKEGERHIQYIYFPKERMI